jgi:hypothetical protein
MLWCFRAHHLISAVTHSCEFIAHASRVSRHGQITSEGNLILSFPSNIHYYLTSAGRCAPGLPLRRRSRDNGLAGDR